METTRTRLIAAMGDALQTRGFHGIGISELLAQAQVPKGVLYHHFPGGKTQLAVAAIEATLERMCDGLDRLMSNHPPLQALRVWIERAEVKLEGSHFERGCPLATVALESTARDLDLRASLARAFETLRNRIATALVAAGYAPERALGLSTLIVSTYEGGLLQARVAGNSQPLMLATNTLLELLQERPRP